MAVEILRQVLGRLLGLDKDDNLILGGTKIIVGHSTKLDQVVDLTALGNVQGATAAEIAAAVTPSDLTYSPYDLRRYGALGNGSTDDTAAINRWISVAQQSGYGLVYPGNYLTTGNHSITARFNMVAIGGGLMYNTARPLFQLTADATNLFNWNGLTNGGPTIQGVLIQGITFHGGNHAVSDALVALQGMTIVTLRDCGFHNVTGDALRLRQFWDSKIQTTMWRACTTTKGLVVVDSRFNADNNQNVNNLTLDQCHMEFNGGPYISVASDSNCFIFRIVNSKFEVGSTFTGPFTLFDFKGGSTLEFTKNTIHGFNSASGYTKLFKLGDTAAASAFSDYDITGNSFGNVDASTAYIDTQGNSAGKFYDNNQSGTNAVGTVSNSSGRAARFEYPFNTSVASDLNQSFSHAQNALSGFIGVDRLGNSGPTNFTADATSLSTTGSVVATASASSIMVSLPMPPFRGFPGSLRIGLRCKSASGAGTIQIQVNTTLFTAQNAPTTNFGVIWFDVTNDFLNVLGNSGSDRFRIQTGSGNAETVTLDGIYLVRCPWHYTKTFTYDPASVANGTSTSTNVTVTGAALGDHVDVYPPYDLQGLVVSAAASSADTVKIVISNTTGGTLDLASGVWAVRVTKR